MIQPKSRTIDDIFSDGQNRIVIPRNQRSFDWGKNEVEELMDDLKQVNKSDAGRLFLGSFVFDNSTEGVLKVVDGQQRLTTISLILLACRAVAKKTKQPELAQEIQKKLTFTDSATGKKVSERITVSPSIREVFQYICDNKWNNVFPIKIETKFVKRQTNLIKPVYDYIFGEIKQYKANELSDFLRALYKTYVIEIVITNELEAFDIFERTNARGLDLNTGDLVKNYLFANILGSDIDEKWNEIVDNSENTLQRMLKYFWVSGHGYVQKKNLYRSLKQYGNEIGPERLTDELHKFSRYYRAVRSLEHDRVKGWLVEDGIETLVKNEGYLGQLNRVFEALKLFQVAQAYPLIYSIFVAYKNAGADSKSTKILLNILENIEKYHFINNAVCDRIGNEVEKLYAERAEDFYKSEDFKMTVDELTKELKSRAATYDEFKPRFAQISYGADTIPLIHYIFDRINNYKYKDSQWISLYNPDRNQLKKNFNIEHFLPQKPSARVEEESMSAVDNIGNLLVLSRHSNSSFGNMTPEQKMKLLEQDPKHSGKLQYVRDFINDYSKLAKGWNGQTISKRAHDLATKSYKEIWGFK